MQSTASQISDVEYTTAVGVYLLTNVIFITLALFELLLVLNIRCRTKVLLGPVRSFSGPAPIELTFVPQRHSVHTTTLESDTRRTIKLLSEMKLK